MNKFERALDQLKKGIQSYVDKMIDNAPFDKTTVGKVDSVSVNNLYTITIDRQQYTGIPCLFKGMISAGDVVKVKIPQNNYNLMYISGKINAVVQSGSTGTENYNDLTNKPQINGNTLSGNKTTSDLGINIPTKTSDLTNDSNFVSDANYVHTDNNFTTTLKDKLDGIESGAEVNVQSDWSQSTTSADDYIKNKPTKLSDFTNDQNFIDNTVSNLTNYYNTTQTDNLLSDKVDKVNGKGLSTNDFTTALKDKLDGVEANANNYSLPIASANSLGGIKVGLNLSIDNDGVLSSNGGYTLPTASDTVKGGIKVGSNLSMNGEVLSATDTTYDAITKSELTTGTATTQRTVTASVLKEAIIDIIYPIGTIYTSNTNTNPSTYFGGTWTSVGESLLVVNDGTTQTTQYKWQRTA